MRADILACYGDTMIDKMIEFVTGEKVTHMAMIIDDANEYVIDTGWCGVKISKLSSFRGKYYVYRCSKLTDMDKTEICSDALSLLNKPYDYLQLLQLFLYKLFHMRVYIGEREKFICVEVIVRLFRKRGITLVPHADADFIFPENVIESKELTIMGKGVFG